jgi:hypothetical protein
MEHSVSAAFQLLQLLFYFYLLRQEVEDSYEENQLSDLNLSVLQFDPSIENNLLLVMSTLHPQARSIWMEVQSRHWIRHVLNSVLLHRKQFEDSFRMSYDSFEKLHRILGTFQYLEVRLIVAPYITLQDTRFRLATPSRVRLLAFLYHIAHGATYCVISNQFGIGESTVSKCIHDCTRQILLRMFHQSICLPSPAEAV